MTTLHCDILVVGGGFSGVCAALAAAREGMDVLLVEQNGALGGAAVNCLVNPFMKYSIQTKDASGNAVKEDINCGIFSEILRRLGEQAGLKENRVTFCEETLKRVLDDLCEEYGVTTLLHTTCIGIRRSSRHITQADLLCQGIRYEAQPAFVMDCSGDANLAALAGLPFQLGRETDEQCQPMTLCFRLNHVDKQSLWEIREQINPLYQRFRAEGHIQNPRENVLLFDHMGEQVVHFNTTRIVGKNPTDPWDLSSAEREARRQVLEIHRFLRANFACFAHSELIMTAPQIGVRESRMIEGEYRITAQDILGCTKFADSIARGCYSIDIHSPDGTGTTIRRIPDGDFYTIPYRACIPVSLDNLLVGGRCISATHEAQSAFRVMPICASIGEGIGITCAQLRKAGLRDVRAADPAQVQQTLLRHGAKY